MNVASEDSSLKFFFRKDLNYPRVPSLRYFSQKATEAIPNPPSSEPFKKKMLTCHPNNKGFGGWIHYPDSCSLRSFASDVADEAQRA